VVNVVLDVRIGFRREARLDDEFNTRIEHCVLSRKRRNGSSADPVEASAHSQNLPETTSSTDGMDFPTRSQKRGDSNVGRNGCDSLLQERLDAPQALAHSDT